MKPVVLVPVLFSVLFLSGCLGTNGHKIDIKRERYQPESEFRPEVYQKELEEADAAHQARLIPGPLKRRLLREELKQKRIGAVVAGIPADPWASYEAERSRILYRKWTDVRRDPPTIKELVDLAIEQGDMKRPELPKAPKKEKDAGDDDDDDDDE